MVLENKPPQNIFSRFYNSLENGYLKMSDWFTEKGIPLNKLNNYIEEKGLPAFPIVLSTFLLILIILIFLLFFMSGQTTITYDFRDYQGNPLTNVFVTITDSQKTIFSGIVENNSSRKAKLKIGNTYSLTATKDGYPDKVQSLLITNKNQQVSIIFEENVEYGFLKVKLKDRENKRTISSGKLTASYFISNQKVVSEEVVDIYNDHYIILELPLNKDIELIVKADNYEDFKETNFRLTSFEQEKIIEMDVSRLYLEGKSKVTFVVLDIFNNFVEDAEVSVFNFQGEEIASQKTIDGKALAYVDFGETISYRVKKEGYKTYVSDEELSIRVNNLEETFTVVLELGGNFLDVETRSKSNFLSLEDVSVTIYSLNNNVIDSGNTNNLGQVKFEGLDSNSEIIVTACKQDYLCEHKIVNLDNESKIEFILERIDVINSAVLNIFVVDEKNMPVSKSNIKIYELINLDLETTTEIPYNTSLQTDLTGSLGIPLRIDKTYRVYAYVGEIFDYYDIKIDPLRENKIIFVIDGASKILKLDLYDENGNKITSGNLLIKTKDGTVLYDEDLVLGKEVVFNTEGYKDLIAEITDENFNRTTVNFSSDDAEQDGYLRIDLSKATNASDYPIIDFVSVLDDKGIKTNYITPNKDYYLVFDILFPENVYKGEVHIRAGEDYQNDSEEMSYGITGFSAMDSTSFKYGTTYNPSPLPGRQSIDVLNEGSSQVLNKWLEIKWIDDVSLGNKQIRVKVRAVDLSSTKLKFNYRVLFEENKLYFRDPIDPILNQSYSNNQKEALYADTKEVSINLFDVPLDCKGDFCFSHKFIDDRDNEFSVEDFFAIKDKSYVLETSIFSLKNNQVSLFAEISKTFPLVSLNLFSDSKFENINPDFYTTIFEASREGINVSEGVLKKVYLSFIAKEIGTSYIDLKAKGVLTDQEIYNERISFNVYDNKEMRVIFNPDVFIDYGSRFSIDVFDSVTSTPIDNAFISFYDERGTFISSTKASGTIGRAGRYTIDNKFNVSRVLVVVESYGYIPYEKEIFIVDNSLLTLTPKEIVINFGLDQMISQQFFSLYNNSEYPANNIRFGEPIWIDGPSDIFIDVRGANVINRKNSQNFDVVVTISNNLNFTTAFAYVPIISTIGSREVTTVVPIRINKGLLLNECIEITEHANTFVGLNLKYTPPDIFNTPINNYDYTGINQQQNPLLSPYQTESTYNDYLTSQNYVQNYTGNDNTLVYNDPNYYTYYSSKPITTSESTENTTFYIIKNNCEQAVTFTPQSVLTSSSSNNDLEISLAHMTILPGEEKAYDVIIRNSSNRTRPITYKYNILWHNNFYSISPSTLNVDLIDLSRALMITPDIVNVPMTQLHPQRAAENSARFFIKNIGSVPITDIHVGQTPKMVTSNIEVTPFPLEIGIIEPGKSVPVDLKFKVNIAQSTMENRLITVTGKAMGVNNPIHATTQLIFSISSPNCLKISNKKIDFSLKVGEVRTRNVSVTNYCAEPVSIIGIDKKQDSYFETFGANPLRIIPLSGNNIIYPNQTATYNLELRATALGGSPSMPVILIGSLLTSRLPVTSEDFLVSINIEDLTSDQIRDREVSIISTIPICEDVTQTTSFSRPVISSNLCTENSGYCDAYSSSELILKKINELQSQIKQVSSQAQAKTLNTGCSLVDAQRGFCKISELGGNIRPLEFTFYMQNDSISQDLIRHVLSKSNYDFKNYLIDVNPFKTTEGFSSLGVYAGGNKIFVSNELTSCGRYKVEIDGFVAASPDYIYPERAYYYITVVDYEKTETCEKNIINYLNYLPWDIPLSKNQREGTWLTLFTGDEELSKGLIKGIGKFGSDPDLRYVSGRSEGATRNNFLNISVGNISENENALAKISFNDLRVLETPNPEQINVLLNEKYKLSELGISEDVSRNFINVVSSMFVKNEYLTDVCVSENKDYMLILKVIEAGDLKFTTRNVSLPLNEDLSCTNLKISSSIDEVLRISSTQVPNLSVGFKKGADDSLSETINVNVLKNKEADFFVCVKPESVNNIPELVGKEIEVVANSIYSGEGKIGQRNATSVIKLETCAITPEKLLEETYNIILTEHNKNENKQFPKYASALVDWSAGYNNQDKEALCSSLEKFILSDKYNERLFYEYEKLGCDIKDPSQKTTSKWNKALTNSGTYFATCFGACALCSIGVNAGLSLIPIIGQIALFKGIVFDCGVFACGIPAAGIMMNVMTDGSVVDSIDDFFSRILATEVSPLASTVEVFGNALQKISTLFGGVHAGVSTSKDALFSAKNLAAIDALPATADVVVPGTTTPGTGGTGVAIVNRPRAPSGKMVNHLNNYVKTMSNNYLPNPNTINVNGNLVPGLNINQAQFTFSKPPNVIDNTVKSLLDNPKVVTGSGAAATVNFREISSAQLDDLLEIIGRSKFDGSIQGYPPTMSSQEDIIKYFKGKDTSYLNKLNNYEISRAATPATPGTTPPATIDPNLKAIDATDYDDLLKTFDGHAKTLSDDLAKIDTQIKDLQSKKYTSNRAKKIAQLNKTKSALESSKSQIDDIVTGLRSGTRVGTQVHIPNDVVTKMTNIHSSGKIPLLAKQTRWAKTANFSAGLIRGLGCGILGNVAGNNYLKSSGKTNLNYSIEFLKNMEFKKNVLYVVEMNYIEPLDNEYESRYTIDIIPYTEVNTQDFTSEIVNVDNCSVVLEEQ